MAADLPMKGAAPAGVTIDVGHSWTQVFVGLSGACETGTTTVDASGGPVSVFNFQGIGSSGCSGAPFVGVDFQVPNSRLVIGIEGEYRWGTDESSVRLGTTETKALTASAKIETSWLLSARAGALLDKDTLLYARLGFGQADGTFDAAIFCDGEKVGDLPTFDVIAYGAGLEHRFADAQGAVRVEYRHLDFSEENIGGGTTIQPSFDQGLIGISWRLGR